jgi:hypothetical protein
MLRVSRKMTVDEEDSVETRGEARLPIPLEVKVNGRDRMVMLQTRKTAAQLEAQRGVV